MRGFMPQSSGPVGDHLDMAVLWRLVLGTKACRDEQRMSRANMYHGLVALVIVSEENGCLGSVVLQVGCYVHVSFFGDQPVLNPLRLVMSTKRVLFLASLLQHVCARACVLYAYVMMT